MRAVRVFLLFFFFKSISASEIFNEKYDPIFLNAEKAFQLKANSKEKDGSL
jgi:hypothetical protein